jgi:hypothetical protein
VKGVSNDNSFQKNLEKGAKQVGHDGEVFVQVPKGMTGGEVRGWLNRFQSQPGRDLIKYIKVKVRVVDVEGTDLGTYNVGERLPPPRTGTGRIYAI